MAASAAFEKRMQAHEGKGGGGDSCDRKHRKTGDSRKGLSNTSNPDGEEDINGNVDRDKITIQYNQKRSKVKHK